MTHAHGRREGGGVERSGDRRRLQLVLVLTALYMVVEAVGGVLSGSLALLADAGHMLTDVASVALALGALWVSQRPATTRHTYAYVRAEILAALVNGLALWAIVGWIAYEAVSRIREPGVIDAGPMLTIAAGGLIVNALAFWILHRPAGEDATRSLNLHGATLHVLGDLLGSIGALTAGAVVWWTGWSAADPIASLLIGGLILVSSFRLVRDAVHVLLEGTPRELDMAALIEGIRTLPGVAGVHDLHVWTITSGYVALSAHVVCAHDAESDMVLARVNRLLRERFRITHTTIQVEPETPPHHDRPMEFPIARL
ncbi:MAG TPA: cation diffusion facilitator family transporter [Gemmatimonadota bacterium]|nr:cation diffusion facilitator family transporter [Gemmatimonadota bacterium]